MLSGSSWDKWRRTLLALFFIIQYHWRMFFLNLRYKARTISHHKQFTGTLRAVKRNLESERLRTVLERARKRLEQLIFVEETPTPPTDLSSLEKLKTAWHSLETSKIARVTPETLKAARHPLKTFKAARNHTTTLITLSLISFLLITLFAASGLASQAFHTMKTLGVSSFTQIANSELNIEAQQAPAINASKALARISQLDESEYASQDEYDTWAYSACSTASMTEVFNAYGRHYRITDVLKVESEIGAITPQIGLVENADIANTAAKFGFQTDWGNDWTLDQVINIANLGRPVITGWPPDRYDGGHIVVVTGGNANDVYLADSSLWNRQVLSRAQFMQWWGGFAAVIMPD